MSSATVYMPPQRSPYFTDCDGAMTTSKRDDEAKQLVLSWADQLASGETISSVAYVDSGVTRSGTSNTTTTTTTTVTGTGETEITVTTSTGRVLQRVIRYLGTDAPIPGDYLAGGL